MISQLEQAFGTSVDADRQVSCVDGLSLSCPDSRQTLMTVVQELDRYLFDGYVKPKSVEVTAIVRKGILDPQMDWFETPKPTGSFN